MKNRYLTFVYQSIKSGIKFDCYFLVLVILSLVGCHLFIDHILWIMNDIGRELYFPLSVLDNNILYKDVFNLFGPFSYLFNAFIYKLFGSSISVIYFIGYITAVISVLGIYNCAKEIVDQRTAFLTGLFSGTIGITATLNFNYCIPYSYAVLYGFIAFIWSLFFFIRYVKFNNTILLYFSMLLAGISAANKYEYFLYALLLISYVVWKNKKNILQTIISILFFLSPIAACYLYLFYMGLDIISFINSFEMVNAIIFSDGYKYLYTNVGTYFSLTNLKISFWAFVKILAFISAIYCSDRLFLKNKICGFLSYSLVIVFSLMYMIKNSYNDFLAFFPILLLVLFVIRYRTLNKYEKLVVLSAILTGLKVFWCCYLKYYGVFFIPVLIIAFWALTKENKLLKKSFSIYLLLLIFAVIIQNISQMYVSNYSIKMSDKHIYTFADIGWKINQAVKYLLQNTENTDKVVVYPEGQIINYITKRPAENFYYALTPPYLEVFGEKNVVEYYKENPPEYFILTNENMRTYNKRGLCADYGFIFCNFIKTNYSKVHTIQYDDEDKEPYYIYRRNLTKS